MAAPGYSDQRATMDELGFKPSVDALLEVITQAEIADTPLTIGVFGAWGSGKTSLMGMIHDRLDISAASVSAIPIWFDAWRYSQSDALWRALLFSIVEEIRAFLKGDADRLRTALSRRAAQHGKPPPSNEKEIAAGLREIEQQLDDLTASLYRTVEREELGGIEIDWGEAGKSVLRGGVRLGLAALPIIGTVSKAIEEVVKSAQGEVAKGEEISELAKAIRRERSQIYRDQLRSLEQFYRSLKLLIADWVIPAGMRLVVFIDDLDRCLPEQAIGVLEAIKVFLDIQGCVFVLGVDRAVIEHGIRVRYAQFALDAAAAARAGVEPAPFPVAERDYLEKIIQVPFELPPLDAAIIRQFLLGRLQTLADLPAAQVEPIAQLMTRGLARNPRKVKRAFNTLRLTLALSKAHGAQAYPVQLAKLAIIQATYFKIYEEIACIPHQLRDLEDAAREIGSPDDSKKNLVKAHTRLRDTLFDPPFFRDLEEAQLQRLIYLTSSGKPGDGL